MSANVWNTGSDVLSVNANTTLISQTFIVTSEGQQTFNITAFKYAPGTGSLLVFRNGQLIKTGLEEDSSTSFKISSTDLNVGDEINVYGFIGITATTIDLAAPFSHSASYPAGSAGAKLQKWKCVTDSPFNAKCDYDPNTQIGTDDTLALQAAFNSGYQVFFPPGAKSKITGPLTATHGIYMFEDSYIQPFGSGYAALTITPQAKTTWSVRVGDGNRPFSGDGIIFGDPTAAGHTQIDINILAARKCVGKGIEINNLWESTVNKVESYGCGGSAKYAVSIKSNVGDSSNTTNYNSIIVGQSDTLALHMATQFSTIGLIHVEEVFTPAIKFVDLDGNINTSIDKFRVYNAGSAEAWIATDRINIGILDTSCNVVFNNAGSFASESVNIDTFINSAQVIENSPNSNVAAGCLISIQNAKLATLITGTAGAFDPGARWLINGGKITTLSVGKNAVGGRTKKGAQAVRFNNLVISNLSERQDGECAFTLDNCSVANTGTYFSGYARFINNTVFDGELSLAGDNTSAVNYHGHVYADNLFVGGAFSTTGNVVGEIYNSYITGDMTATNGGTSELSLVFKNTGCGGAVAAAFGSPPTSYDRDNGIHWGLGKSADNIKAAIGSPKGWICTNSGANTWTSTGNL